MYVYSKNRVDMTQRPYNQCLLTNAQLDVRMIFVLEINHSF
jgi:hypothetical protein